MDELEQDLIKSGLKLEKFGRTLLGPAATQLGELLGDIARSWRLKNLLSISDKVDAKCREKGFDPEGGQKMALSIGLPLIAKGRPTKTMISSRTSGRIFLWRR